MAREKKDGLALNVRIDAGIYHELESICDDAGQTKTKVVERALQAYFSDYRSKQEKLKMLEDSAVLTREERVLWNERGER